MASPIFSSANRWSPVKQFAYLQQSERRAKGQVAFSASVPTRPPARAGCVLNTHAANCGIRGEANHTQQTQKMWAAYQPNPPASVRWCISGTRANTVWNVRRVEVDFEPQVGSDGVNALALLFKHHGFEHRQRTAEPVVPETGNGRPTPVYKMAAGGCGSALEDGLWGGSARANSTRNRSTGPKATLGSLSLLCVRMCVQGQHANLPDYTRQCLGGGTWLALGCNAGQGCNVLVSCDAGHQIGLVAL